MPQTAIRFFLVLAVTVAPAAYFNSAAATEFFHVKATWLNGFVTLAALAYGVALVRGDIKRLYIPPTFAPILGLCLAAALSIPGSLRPWRAWETALMVGGVIPFVFLFVQAAANREQMRRFLVPVALVNIGIAAFAFLQYYGVADMPTDRYGTPDPSSTVGLTNFMVEYFFPLLFVWPVLALRETQRLPRVAYWLAAILEWWYLIISDNRAGLVAVVAAAGVLVVFGWLRFRGAGRLPDRRRIAIGGFAVAVMVALLAVSPIGGRIADRGSSIFDFRGDYAIQFRLETWKQSFGIIADHPLTGIGVGNSEFIFPLYKSSFLENMTKRQNTRIQHIHNEYLQVLLDMGIIGLLFGGWFLLRLFQRMRTMWARAPDGDHAFAAALTAGMMGTLVLAFFAFPFQIPAPALSFMFALGLLEVYTGRIYTDEDEAVSIAPRAASLGGSAVLVLAVTLGAYATTKMAYATLAHVNHNYGLAAKKFRQYDEAKEYFETAIEQYPEDEAFYFDRAVISLMRQDIIDAIRYFEETTDRHPYYAAARKQVGVLSARIGNYEKAARELAIAYRAQPRQVEEYVPLLVNAHLALEKADEAVAIAAEAVEKKADSAILLYQLGRAQVAAGDYQKGLGVLDQAIALDPSNKAAKVQKGKALVALGRHEEGLAVLDETAAGLGTVSRYDRQTSRAKAFLETGRLAEAKGALLTLMRSVPSARERLRQEKTFSLHPEIRPLLFDGEK